MIFVTIGASRGFPRLITRMDEIAGEIDEEVVIQTGFTEYRPFNARYFTFASHDEILELIQQARILVTHGASTIVDALRIGHPVIVVPRLKEYGEVINDHQLELCQALEKVASPSPQPSYGLHTRTMGSYSSYSFACLSPAYIWCQWQLVAHHHILRASMLFSKAVIT